MTYLACVPNISPGSKFATSGFIVGYSNALMSTGLMIGICVLLIASICALTCCRMDQKVPINYVLLFVFTFSEAWLISSVCQRTDPKIVLEAAALTTAMVVAITLYAMFTKTDFTICGPILYICLLVFSVAGLFLAVFGFRMGLLWSVIGVILFSFYLVHDTQMILGGKARKYVYTPDMYILASVNLYLDIINIFLYILSIMGNSS